MLSAQDSVGHLKAKVLKQLWSLLLFPDSIIRQKLSKLFLNSQGSFLKKQPHSDIKQQQKIKQHTSFIKWQGSEIHVKWYFCTISL